MASCGCWQKEKLIKRSKRKIRWEEVDERTVKGITNNLGGVEFFIDKEDYDKCKDICWSAQKVDKCKTYYIHGKTTYCGNCEYIHRFILGLDSSNKNVVDHIDHNGTNNKKENLRTVTHSQNAMNMANYKNNGTIHGVNWNEEAKLWIVEIWANKKRIYLGNYDDYEIAVKARKEAEEKYFGEYSYDNSIGDRRKAV